MIDGGLPKAPRVEVSEAWLAEQQAKRAAYEAERDKWRRALEPVTHYEHPEAALCRCKKCRKLAAAQLKLPF